MIDLIGAPFDLAGRRPGSRLGPAAVRLAGLKSVLEAQGLNVLDRGDIDVPEEGPPGDGLRSFEEWLVCLRQLRDVVGRSLGDGRLPLVIGGDHSLAVGGVSAALAHTGGDLAVLWIDAHADLNTPASSLSGNAHGMPLAALMGLESGVEGQVDRQWRQILNEIVPATRLNPNLAAWFGLRELDVAEQETIRANGAAYTATMHEIDRNGIVTSLQRFDHWLRNQGGTNLWISFDVDALDPILAPGTGTAVRGGLTYREAHLVAEMIRELLDALDCPYRLLGVDLVETNPLFDTNNETAKTAVEWIASLFGKTILGKAQEPRP